MYATTILAAGLASLAAAAPSFTPSSAVKENASVSHTIHPGVHDHQLTGTQFDDLTALPAVPLQVIGEYKELYYSGQLLTNFGVAGIQLAGVIPHSGDQVSSTGLQGQTLGGRAALLSDYSGSTTETFDLKKFWYACALK